MNRYRKDIGPSRAQLAQQAMQKLGYDYMHGSVSVEDIQAFICSDKVRYSNDCYNTVGGVTEAWKLIAAGVEEALFEDDVMTYEHTPCLASRRQPEQGAADLATIYPNGVKNAKKFKKYNNGAIPKPPIRFTNKELEALVTYPPTLNYTHIELTFTR
jgi:hypothetical protein